MIRALKRYASSATLLVIMAISLAGCVHIDRGVTLNGDGSGSYLLTIGFADALVTSSTDSTSTMMNQFGAQVKQAGGSFREYEQDGYTYWAYTRPFSSVSALNTYLTQMPQASDSTGLGSSGASATTDTITVTEQQGFPGNTFHVKGQLSLSLPSGSDNTGGVDLSSYLKDMRDSFAVTMPGSVTAHTGGTLNGNTVTYLIHGGEQTNIDVTGSSLNLSALVPIGAAVVVLLLAIVGFIIWRRRSAKTAQPAMQVAYGVTPSTPSAPTWPAGAASQPFTPPSAPLPGYTPAPPYEVPPESMPPSAPLSTPSNEAPPPSTPSQAQWPGSGE